jgi:alkylated DNA repair dioxygenase AlkB
MCAQVTCSGRPSVYDFLGLQPGSLMSSLFSVHVDPSDIPQIPGLSYLPGYITVEEETLLAQAIDAEPWDTTWERRRQPYGWSYGKGEDLARPIPTWGTRLAERMHAEGLSERMFDQMLVNEYLPGQGIAMHCDYQPFDRTVASLSLLTACVMDFRHVDDSQRASLLLEPRSLLILSDEARYKWQHGIARRKNDRWHDLSIARRRRLSVTFRLARRSK